MHFLSLPPIVALLACLSLSAFGQAYPTKPVRLFTQFAAGNSGDIALRIVATAMSKSLGQPVIVDNRPGAGGVLAVDQLKRSAPDGYSIVAVSTGVYIARQFLVKDMGFDPQKDLTPVTQFLRSYFLMVASPIHVAGSLKELIETARISPGKVNYGTSGIGTEGHLMAEEIMERTGVRLTHIPYKDATQPLLDTVAGQIQATFATYSGALPYLNSGKLKALAAVKETRLPALPNVPTLGEVIPGFDPLTGGVGVFGPGGLPEALARRLQAEFVRAVAEPEAQAKLKEGGFEPLLSSPEVFAEQMRREISLTARLVKAAGIKPE